MVRRDAVPRFEGLEFVLLVFILIVSFFHDFDEKLRFTFFADKLIVVSGVKFSSAHRTERDFSSHLS